MFTGLVEEVGMVTGVEERSGSIRLGVRARVSAKGVRVGDSIAVNGCCLTVVGIRRASRGTDLEFDLLRESWERTNFADLKVGSGVNLERSLAAGGRMGGHFVTGHVDGTGRILRLEKRGRDHVLEVEIPAGLRRYVVYKGSLAVDGVSLTVAGVLARGCRIWLIPHTLAATTLGSRGAGDRVNLETDLLAKYVERLVVGARGRRQKPMATPPKR